VSFSAIIYDANGRILSSRSNAQESELVGQTYIKGDVLGDLEDFYVKDSAIVAKPTQPSAAHTFDYSTKAWTLDLSLAKAQAWARIKSDRNLAEFGTFTWDSNTFQCDAQSQQRILNTVQRARANLSFSSDWTLADNSSKTFSGADYINIGVAMSQHIDDCHKKARGYRADIDAATTEEQVDAVQWG